MLPTKLSDTRLRIVRFVPTVPIGRVVTSASPHSRYPLQTRYLMRVRGHGCPRRMHGRLVLTSAAVV